MHASHRWQIKQLLLRFLRSCRAWPWWYPCSIPCLICSPLKTTSGFGKIIRWVLYFSSQIPMLVNKRSCTLSPMALDLDVFEPQIGHGQHWSVHHLRRAWRAWVRAACSSTPFANLSSCCTYLTMTPPLLSSFRPPLWVCAYVCRVCVYACVLIIRNKQIGGDTKEPKTACIKRLWIAVVQYSQLNVYYR